ncbi:hypothetical protein F5B21DRAFT_488810 [Xylaria acuta]|nr:hypothetical protein F5B21DRAFT_488810 [Xylaria acuta]
MSFFGPALMAKPPVSSSIDKTEEKEKGNFEDEVVFIIQGQKYDDNSVSTKVASHALTPASHFYFTSRDIGKRQCDIDFNTHYSQVQQMLFSPAKPVYAHPDESNPSTDEPT